MTDDILDEISERADCIEAIRSGAPGFVFFDMGDSYISSHFSMSGTGLLALRDTVLELIDYYLDDEEDDGLE